MNTPFPLESAIGHGFRSNRKDVVQTKKAFQRIGYFAPPSYGFTEFPDLTLLSALKHFQLDNRLNQDGVMKPKGKTALALGALLDNLQSHLVTSRNNFGLLGELDRRKIADPHDIATTKRSLALLGFYPLRNKEAPKGYLDDELYEAIHVFQSATRINPDGKIRQYGDTEKMMNQHLEPLFRNSQGLPKIPPSLVLNTDDQGVAVNFLPPIVLKIAEFFGMAVMAAWVWWQSMSKIEKEKVRKQIESNKTGGNTEEVCDHLYFNVDVPVCNAISRQRGKHAATRCFASAAERYAACRRGVPIELLPPLDTWNN